MLTYADVCWAHAAAVLEALDYKDVWEKLAEEGESGAGWYLRMLTYADVC